MPKNNLKFERKLQQMIDEASVAANETGKKQIVCIQENGRLSFDANLRGSSIFICEVFPAPQAFRKDWIQIAEKGWIDITKFHSIKIQPGGKQIICSGDEGDRGFACDERVVLRELERISFPGFVQNDQAAAEQPTDGENQK